MASTSEEEAAVPAGQQALALPAFPLLYLPCIGAPNQAQPAGKPVLLVITGGGGGGGMQLFTCKTAR